MWQPARWQARRGDSPAPTGKAVPLPAPAWRRSVLPGRPSACALLPAAGVLLSSKRPTKWWLEAGTLAFSGTHVHMLPVTALPPCISRLFIHKYQGAAYQHAKVALAVPSLVSSSASRLPVAQPTFAGTLHSTSVHVPACIKRTFRHGLHADTLPCTAGHPGRGHLQARGGHRGHQDSQQPQCGCWQEGGLPCTCMGYKVTQRARHMPLSAAWQ